MPIDLLWRIAESQGRIIALSAAIVSVVFTLEGCQRSSPGSKPQQEPGATNSTPSPTAIEPPNQAEASSASPSELSAPATAMPAETSGIGGQLFTRHCAACHGERGDGKGIAARFLFPKPRNLRTGRFRLVSTNNSVPTRDDLLAVLLRGMPGSAMPPWAHLSQEERVALVDEVLRIRRDGQRESYIQLLKEQEELTEEELAADEVQQEIRDHVEEFTTPGESTTVPDIGTPTDDAIARGKTIYAKFACISCHGETGRGDGVQEMWDDEQMPARPRDFTLGIFKGNHDPASLYRRIAYGMPGTPMPSSSSMTPEQMVDLVHYVRSMSTEEQRQAAIAKREKIIARLVDAIPQSLQQDAWARYEPVHLRMTPLWWRNDADPDLTAQVVHDGHTIAVRLTWRDESNDQHALHSESFKDAVAMELFRGPLEPFLGMGDKTSPVDVWFWDADRQNGPDVVETSYPNAVVDVYPFSETVASGPDLNRPGARMVDQPDVSLPARASGNQIVPRSDESGGSTLHAGGPSSVTFRIPQSQLVRAHGVWSDGRWTVVLTRSLSVPSPDDGVSLESGGRASVAFAVWNGSHRDRDGQKSITIWQDLELE